MSDEFYGKDREQVLKDLAEYFPTTAHKRHPNKGFTYIEGHTVIRRVIEATNNTWDMEVKSVKYEDLGDGNMRVTAMVRITIPTLGSREHIGVQTVYAKGEDLVKGAVTDAIKKCMTLFGPGLELYGPDYESGEVAVNRIPQQQGQQRPQQSPQRNQAPTHTGTPNQGSGGSQGHTGGGIPASDKQWGMFNALVAKHKLNGAVVARDVGKVDDMKRLTGGRDGTMSKCINALKAIDDGGEIPAGWHLDKEGGAVARPSQAPRQVQAKSGRELAKADILAATTIARLDEIYDEMNKYGLGEDAELVQLLTEKNDELELVDVPV